MEFVVNKKIKDEIQTKFVLKDGFRNAVWKPVVYLFRMANVRNIFFLPFAVEVK